MTYTCAAAGFSNDFSQTSSVSCFCCIYGFDCNNSTHNGKEVDNHQDSLMTYKNRLWKVESNQKSRMGQDDVKHGKTVAVFWTDGLMDLPAFSDKRQNISLSRAFVKWRGDLERWLGEPLVSKKVRWNSVVHQRNQRHFMFFLMWKCHLSLIQLLKHRPR